MGNGIVIAEAVSIRDAGYDEYWLQDQIWSKPAMLGLGDLDAIGKERRQNGGGRLDILLKNPEDDTMYEVEVMLGETDPTHIVRTIEYWDNEKRRWPQRQHYAVLVSEHINRRFFNVIHILSHAVPIIGIQASLLDVDGKQSLFFTKIIDTFEEVDDGSSATEQVKRDDWLKEAKWTVEAADKLFAVTAPFFTEPALKYLKGYIGITVGHNNYFWLRKRSGDKTRVGVRIASHLENDAQKLLYEAGIPFKTKPERIFVTIDASTIDSRKDTFGKLAGLTRRTWEKDSLQPVEMVFEGMENGITDSEK